MVSLIYFTHNPLPPQLVRAPAERAYPLKELMRSERSIAAGDVIGFNLNSSINNKLARRNESFQKTQDSDEKAKHSTNSNLSEIGTGLNVLTESCNVNIFGKLMRGQILPEGIFLKASLSV